MKKIMVIFLILFSINLFGTLKSFEGTWVLHWWEESGKLENYCMIDFQFCNSDYFTGCDWDYEVKIFYDGSWKSCGYGYLKKIDGIGHRFDFKIWAKEFTVYFKTIENYIVGNGFIDCRPSVWWAEIPVMASISKF